MNESSFLRKRGEVGHGRRQATPTTPRLLATLIALLLLGLTASSGTSAAVGTVFTVDTTDGTTDGICGGASDCSFGDAIEAANANPGKDTIAFTGPLSIALESALPPITDPVEIDGTTQPGCAGSPIVEVRATGNLNGLVLNAGDSTVCGLVLNRLFDAIQVNSSDNRIEGNFIGTDVAGAAALANAHVGILIFSGARNQVDRNVISGNGNGLEISAFSSGNGIQGNHFGTNATGTAALPNGGSDLAINSDNDTIGGTVAAARNIVAGKVVIGEPSTGAVVQGNYFGTDETGGRALEPRFAVGIQGTRATIGGSEGVTPGGPCTGACNVFANALILGGDGNHVVQGNFLGTDFSGSVALGLSWGIEIAGFDNLIGGTDPAERNLISGNSDYYGVLIANTSSRNRVVGNFIGTDASGTHPLPNFVGILCCGFGDDNTIEGNVIAFNGEGVHLTGAGQGLGGTVGNAILGNSIFANDGLGIELGPSCYPCGDGPTANDPGDGDAGPNGHQNFPVITRVTVDNGVTTIEGTLNSRPDSTYHVELFRNSECDSSHFGEGETFMDSTSVHTGPDGDGSFAVTYPVALGPTEVVTSTATDARNNTSEFSECLADLSVTKSDDPDPVAVGAALTYTIDVANDGPAPATAVRVIDTLPSDVTLTSITSSQGSCDKSTVTCTLGSIGRGGTARVTIVVDSGSTRRTLTNTARVSSELRDPDESDNTATATTEVVAGRPARIVVRKVTVPSPDPTDTSFAFTAGGGLSPASFSLRNDQSHTFADLVPQAGYSVAETTPTGWDSTSACSDGSPASNIDVGAGETVTCTFTNTKRGLARVKKTVSGRAPTGSQSFCFELRTGASATTAGTILESRCANAGNGGVIDFTMKLVPATTYALCEIVMPGWMTTLGPPFYVVFNASGDNSTVCTDFKVDPGQIQTFTIDNKSPPNGLARTIGFWKNWASCAASNGKQRPVLDQTLAAADPAGIRIGTLTLHAGDCVKAVRLLDKSAIDTGKKMASDPAFSLAAQLLAAKLNTAAGAGSCPAAVSAINNGQTLLAATHFNGITHDKLSAAQATQATALATTLDRYNNSLLC